MELTVRGLTFQIRAGGPEDGPVVLLLHGFPQHGGEWDAVVPALRDAGLRTIAPDLRGYSPGARPAAVADYRVAESVADVLAIADALGAGERFDVVGHDWGAVVGWCLAAAHPDRVRTLTALSVPHPGAVQRALVAGWDQRRRSAYILLFRQRWIAERVLLARNARALRTAFAGSGLDDAAVERYLAPLREPGALTAALNWYRAVDLQVLAATPPVEVPTTYLWSDGDPALGPVAAADCAEFVRGPYTFLSLAGVSHWIPDQRPAAVIEAILGRVGAG